MTAVEPPRACPVCDERHETTVSRCFRCQTTLTGWWNLESALASPPERAAVPVAAHVPASGFQRVAPLAVTGVASLLLGFTLARVPSAAGPDAPVPPTRSAPAPPQVIVPPQIMPPAEPPTPSRIIVYRVQRGDTLWRISAALTGDGRNWTRLWPGRTTRPATLRAGTTLRVPVDD